MRRGQGGDRGSALIEFVGASVILLLPLVYLLLTVFTLQRASFGASQAAREAGRALATAPSSDIGAQRAAYAVQLAFADQGVTEPAELRFTAEGAGCGAGAVSVRPRLSPGAAYTVCVRQQVYLPYADRGFFAHLIRPRVTVVGRYTLRVDPFRAPV